MITQKQQEERQQRAKAAVPREEKQTATLIPSPSRPASASPRRWIDVLLRILGIALVFADGFLFGWGVAAENVGYMLVLGMLMVLVGAFLLRSWWALVIVPVVFVVGNVLGELWVPLVQRGWPAWPPTLQAAIHWSPTVLLLILSLLVSLLLGTGLGIVFKQWWEQR